MAGGQLISIHPEELTFEVELEKPAYCNLKFANNSQHHVAFKVKTTSPMKYFVRPNMSFVQPWDSCTVVVTLKAQKELPPDMQCNDKFLLQSTIVPPAIVEFDEIPPDTFVKDDEKVIEERRLRVVFVTPKSVNANIEGESRETSAAKPPIGSSDVLALLRVREERVSILQQNKMLQREIELLNRRRTRESEAGFSLTFTACVLFFGILVGFILKFALSSHSNA